MVIPGKKNGMGVDWTAIANLMSRYKSWYWWSPTAGMVASGINKHMTLCIGIQIWDIGAM